VAGGLELLLGQVLLEDDALHRAAAVAQGDELQLALVGALLHPAGKGDILADVVGGLVDFDGGGQCRLPFLQNNDPRHP